MRKLALVISLLLLYRGQSYAQEPALRHFGVSDGLPSATVYNLIQDKQGYLWIATDAGVARFDGRNFTVFTIADGLPDNEVIRVGQDSWGRIWFLCLNGSLSYYLNGKIVNEKSNPALRKLRINTAYLGLFEDRHRRLWFYSIAGIFMLDGDSVRRAGLGANGFVYNRSDGKGVFVTVAMSTRDRVRNFIENKGSFREVIDTTRSIPTGAAFHQSDESVLFVSEKGVVRARDMSRELIVRFGKEFDSTRQPGLLLARDSGLWISTTGNGLYRYDYRDLSKPPVRYLKGKATCNLFQDHEGNIWVATLGEGLYMFPSWFSKVRNYTKETGLRSSQVYSVAKDNDGILYAGLNDGCVNTISDGKIALLNDYVTDTRQNRLLRILIHNDDIWLLADLSFRHVNKKNGLDYRVPFITDGIVRSRTTTVKDAYFKNGKVFIAGNHAICRFVQTDSGKEGLLFAVGRLWGRAYSVFIDHADRVWYAAGTGLGELRGDSCLDHSKEHPLLRQRISCIRETGSGELLLASAGYGLLFYKDGKIIRQLLEKDGLPSNDCKKIFTRGNDIYVATTKGIARFRVTGNSCSLIRTYTQTDGLLSNNINDLFVDSLEICAASSSGLSVIDVDASIPFRIPPLYLNTVLCNGTPVNMAGGSDYDYSRRSFVFSFGAIAFQAPDQVHYQYRIQDSQHWTDTRSTRLEFPYLSHGKYQFQVRARLRNGTWSQPAAYCFSILPPFWLTPWFFVLIIVSAVLLTMGVYRWRMNSIRRKRDEKLRLQGQIVHLEQQALQSMMNPHFVFNVMNSIQHYINQNDRHEANIYLSDFARLIRLNLDVSAKSQISLDEEIIYLQLYLSLESLRFLEGLTYGITVDPDIDGDEVMIPVMMLQPFLENAIWHGVLPMRSPGHIDIIIEPQGQDLIRVRITDNGIGISESGKRKQENGSGHVSKALRLTTLRLELISKMTGQVLYASIRDRKESGEGQGTSVELLLPSRMPA
jgi:ligand-binding sensor domain-containing protein/signal transduction histidine kinase